MGIITAIIGNRNYETVIQSESNTILADEPVSSGGTNKGFSPHELLSSALASCTCITLRMYADRKKWNLDNVISSVTITNDAKQNILTIHLKIELIGKLSATERERLFEIAKHCPIHKVLINSITIETELA